MILAKKLTAVMLVATMALAATALLVAGCGGGSSKPSPNRPKPLKSYAYECESCKNQFGVPVKMEVFPPIVCPKCSKRTAVRAHHFVPAGGGEPVVIFYSKYDDKQIAEMEKYRAETPADQLADFPPDAWVVTATGSGPQQRAPGTTAWIKEMDMSRQGTLGGTDFLSKVDRKRPFEVYPKDWPVVEESQVKQR